MRGTRRSTSGGVRVVRWSESAERNEADGPFSPALVQPHQFCRIVFQHHLHFIRLDAEPEQSADEDPHAVDRIQVQDRAEVAAADATVGTEFVDRADGLQRVGDWLTTVTVS